MLSYSEKKQLLNYLEEHSRVQEVNWIFLKWKFCALVHIQPKVNADWDILKSKKLDNSNP